MSTTVVAFLGVLLAGPVIRAPGTSLNTAVELFSEGSRIEGHVVERPRPGFVDCEEFFERRLEFGFLLEECLCTLPNVVHSVYPSEI
jgi:hypothetical protein